MIKIKHFRIYCGHVGYGWLMYGIGYKYYWFLGYSKNITKEQP